MNASPDTPAAPRVLTMRPLGLDERSEAAYRELLGRPDCEVQVLAEALELPVAALEPVLEGLRARGLVRATADLPKRWSATPPDAAVEMLLIEREIELNQARLIVPELQQQLRLRERGSAEQPFRIVSADAQEQINAFFELTLGAQHEVARILCLPLVFAGSDATRVQELRPGVRVRTLIAPEVLALPGWPAAAEKGAAVGEELRVLSDLPFKLLLADHSAALLPLRAGTTDSAMVRVGESTLLEALRRLFEQLWEQGVPLLDSRADDVPAPALAPDLQSLLALLAAGTNDKAAADLLGISERTLVRRIAALGEALGAKTRFQCGWLAARRFPDAGSR